MNQQLYRIRSGRVWYKGRSGWCRDEHDSPVFTNRLSAERKMRSELKTSRELIELKTSRELSETRRYLPWQVDNHAKWCAAEIVVYDLVPVQ
jgi:hypothetical protein